MDVLVVQPAVGRAHEVLIFDVDEPLGLADGRGVGPRYGVVHGATLLRREGRLILQLKSAGKKSTMKIPLELRLNVYHTESSF